MCVCDTILHTVECLRCCFASAQSLRRRRSRRGVYKYNISDQVQDLRHNHAAAAVVGASLSNVEIKTDRDTDPHLYEQAQCVPER